MVIPQSARSVINFFKEVYAGNRDSIFVEIEGQGPATATAEALFTYPKFGLVAAVQDRYVMEKEQALNALRYQQQADSQPGSAQD